jgi:hypothetical protein
MFAGFSRFISEGLMDDAYPGHIREFHRGFVRGGPKVFGNRRDSSRKSGSQHPKMVS